MAEGRTQQFGSIFTPRPREISSRQGVGLEIPERDLAHSDPQWYECDLDDPIEDPDAPDFDPLPTARHREIPS